MKNTRHFDDMEDELEKAEESLLENVESFQPVQLITMRKNLMRLRKTLYHEREILVKICRLDCPFISEKAIVHYRDIYDHLSKFFELTETYREIETSLMELYTSLLNNLMTKMSNDTNISVKRLTLIATIFMPLTLLCRNRRDVGIYYDDRTGKLEDGLSSFSAGDGGYRCGYLFCYQTT